MTPDHYEIISDDVHAVVIAKTWTASNARLIACAPELLTALVFAVEAIRQQDDFNDTDSHIVREWEALIAKAQA